MTSTASQPQSSAPNPSSSAAPSYASAAGANKKPTTPLIATGTNPATVAANTSSAPIAQNGKPVSASPVNGQANQPAAPVPINGATNSHARKQSSIVIGSTGPIVNGGLVAGSRSSNIQFGSPSLAQASPNLRHIPSPAHSPSPIPIPMATGGRPNMNAGAPPPMTFGSFPGDNAVSIHRPWQ
jgi:translation initiation factor 4G